eukprot:TRINITY_DN7117_c0_g1_i5.p1 TRINITY_DN7117_c0_g1~~TRINITY_DN7117_c0_g1_i5.p1  ORF type:complete len:2201 (-),score=318.83 TRINITY_DN7117_c0_g1_i5:388-6837(-)
MLQLILLGWLAFVSLGFLEEELPLSIVTTTPTELVDNGGAVSVSGQQTITVVFSRPVIALGSDFAQETFPSDKVPFSLSEDIPGSFRWVTTYIARWDPEGSWPSDWDLDLVWNPDLTTWDDVPLNLTGIPKRVPLQTPSQSFSVSDVESELAKNLTDGEWGPSSTQSYEGVGEPEVPPDGILILSFNEPINHTMLNGSLIVHQEDVETDIKAFVFPCKRPEYFEELPVDDTCARVVLEGELDIAGRYTLKLPEGTKYHPRSGPIRQTEEFQFYGLKEFRFPFVYYDGLATAENDDQGLSYRRFDLWLLHGLNDNITIEDLKETISLRSVPLDFDGRITDDLEIVDFELEFINKGRVQLSAAVRPSSKYILSVEASEKVIDGFGLPLKEPVIWQTYEGGDDYLVFSMRQLDEVFSILSPASAIFEDLENENYQWPLISRKVRSDRNTLSAWAITKDNLMDILMIAHNGGDQDRFLSNYIGQADFEKKGSTDPLELDISDINQDDLLAQAGAFVTQECCRYRWRDGESTLDAMLPEFVFKTSLNFVYFLMGEKALVFVTDMKSGLPMQGVSAKIFQVKDGQYTEPNLIVEGISNEEGIATLDVTKFQAEFGQMVNPYSDTYVLVLENTEGQIYIQVVNTPYQESSGDQNELLTVKDRELVRPGETLKIKGYLRQNMQTEFTIPKGVELSVSVSPSFTPADSIDYYYYDYEAEPEVKYVPEYNEEYGSFVVDIPIPDEARLQEYIVDFYYLNDYLGAEYFTVADPRPPTATLDVQVPDWVRPDGIVEVEVLATSLIGASVETEMTLTWTLGEQEGVETIVTDASGAGTYSLDLSELGNFTVGSSIAISIEWIGPTRERITQDVSVPLKLSDKSVSFSTSLSTNVPGIEFELRAGITGLGAEETRVLIYAMNITDQELMYDGTLDESFPEYVSFIGSEYGLTEEHLIFQVGANDCSIGSGCTYSLPDVGQYVLAACFKEDDELICQGMIRGNNFTQWNDLPLSQHFDFYLDLEYTDGDDTATLWVDIPYDNVQVFVLWGNELQSKQQKFELQRGMQSMQISVGDECIGGCSVSAGFTVPRQDQEIVQPIPIPTSKLFDPAAAHTIVLTSSLTKTVKSTELKVELQVADEVIEPGFNTTVEVTVYSCDIEGTNCIEPQEEAEVTIIAVDKSILEALPYSPQVGRFVLDLLWYAASETIDSDDLIAPNAVQAVLDFVREIVAADPFVRLPLDVSHSNGRYSKADVDLTLKEYLTQFKNQLTAFSSGNVFGFHTNGFLESELFYDYAFEEVQAMPMMPMMPMISAAVADAGPVAQSRAVSRVTGGDDDEGGASGGGATVSVRIEDDFITTPLFSVIQTTSDGKGQATFTGPPNLGTFVVRAYATTKDVQLGQAETELIVRRGVSLTAALPRGVRVGDTFEAGAVITVTGAEVAGVEVSATLTINGDASPIKLQQGSDLQRTVTTGADGTLEVTFPFEATNIGEADVQITVEVADGKADALQVTFPVEGVQDPVVVASSFAVSGNQSGWTEGLDLPDALPGSGSVDLLAGVGRLPAIQAIASVLFNNEPDYRVPQAHYALSALLVKPILEVYGVNEGELYDNATKRFDAALTNLTVGNLTLDETVGLMYRIPIDTEDVPDDADVYLNAYAAYVGLQVLDLKKQAGRSSSITRAEQALLDGLIQLWTGAAQTQLVKDALESRKSIFPGPYYSLTNIALVRLILGEEGLVWVPEVMDQEYEQQVVEDLSLVRLSENIDELSVEAKAYFALLLLKDEEERKEVQDILDDFTSSTRVGGRTAYISYSPSSAYPISPFSQGMALLTYSNAQSFNALVEKLANYLGGPLNSNVVASSYLGYSSSAAVMLSLTAYDQQKGSTQPNLSVTARSSNVTLLEALFDEASDLPVETSTKWEELDSPPAPIDVKAEGTGEATVAALLDFIPRDLITFPVYRGFHVTSIVQMADPITQAPTGPALSAVPLGSVVAITVQVTTPDRYSDSRVRVLMPGGLEPIDPNLDDDAGMPCFLPWLRRYSFGGYGWFSFWWCPEQETRPQVVTFDVTRIGPGATEFNVLAVAATRGTFVMPSVKAFVVDEPEILGLSAAGYFEVCEDCEPRLLEDAIQPAKECPNDCNGLGVCNVQSGTCNCNDGFIGDDCGGFVEE